MVLVASLLVGVSKLELAVLILTIMLVFVTEMFNTAMEFVVDLATREYHPLAKLAKDVSAGAVLVSSVGAVLVGYLILADDLGPLSLETLESIRRSPAHLTLVALGRGRPRRASRQGPHALPQLLRRRDALGARGGRLRGLGRGQLHRRRGGPGRTPVWSP